MFSPQSVSVAVHQLLFLLLVIFVYPVARGYDIVRLHAAFRAGSVITIIYSTTVTYAFNNISLLN